MNGAIVLLLIIVIGAFIVLGWVFYILFLRDRFNNEREKESRRIIDEKFSSIDVSRMLGMTSEEIASETGASFRHIFFLLISRKIKCKDFDGSISSEEREKIKEIEKSIGRLVPQIICPHCQTKGQVHKQMDVKRSETTTDITNMTAAILSGTKLTVKKVTQLHCTNCGTAWDI